MQTTPFSYNRCGLLSKRWEFSKYLCDRNVTVILVAWTSYQNYQILLAPCLRKYRCPPLFWLMREWRACWRVCSWRERAMSSCRPMSIISDTLWRGPDIFISMVSMHHRFNTKLARHHCTFTCDVGVVSIHPVWVWLCDHWTAKTFSRSLCQWPIRENFVPQKLLTIQYRICTSTTDRLGTRLICLEQLHYLVLL